MQSIDSLKGFLQEYKSISLYQRESSNCHVALFQEIYICNISVQDETFILTSRCWNGKTRKFRRSYDQMFILIDFMDSVAHGKEKDYPCYKYTTFALKFRHACKAFDLISEQAQFTEQIEQIDHRGLPVMKTVVTLSEAISLIDDPKKILCRIQFNKPCEIWKCAELAPDKCYPWNVTFTRVTESRYKRITTASMKSCRLTRLTIAEICEFCWAYIEGYIDITCDAEENYRKYKEENPDKDIPEDVLTMSVVEYEEAEKEKANAQLSIMEKNIEETKRQITSLRPPAPSEAEIEANGDSDDELLNYLEN